MASDAFYLAAADDDDGMHAYYSDDDDQEDAGRYDSYEAPRPLTLTLAVRRKQAAGRKAPRGPLRSVRRRPATAPGCAGLWGGKRRREFTLWRQRCVDERRRAMEKARWSCVRAPPGLLDPIFLGLEIDFGDG